jgi:hypothetical protein
VSKFIKAWTDLLMTGTSKQHCKDLQVLSKLHVIASSSSAASVTGVKHSKNRYITNTLKADEFWVLFHNLSLSHFMSSTFQKEAVLVVIVW